MLWACAQGAGHVSCRFAKLKAVTDCDVEPCWSVGSILSAGPYSGKQRRLNLAAGRPRPIRTEQHLGGQRHRFCWATLSGYWLGDTHGNQLHHIPCCLLGTTGAWHDWCRGVHRPAVVHHAGGGRSGAGDGAHGTGKRAPSLVIEHMQSGVSWAIRAALDELMGAARHGHGR